MFSSPRSGYAIIIASFLIALALVAIPMPTWATYWRPPWVALVLLYWCMAVPERIGIGHGWCFGLLLDVQLGNVLGQHALGLSVLAYLTLKFHLQIRSAQWKRQLIIASFYLSIYKLLEILIMIVLKLPLLGWANWLPVITGSLLWPWIFIVFRDIRRRYNISTPS